MAAAVRDFIDHRKELQEFVVQAVGLIMQRLNEQEGRAIKCLYCNEEVRKTLLNVLEPLADRY